jgi:hypothetical protein
VTGSEGGPSRRRARRWPLLVVAALAVADATCGEDALGSFTSSYASAVCRRAFECCSAADAMRAVNAADEAACVAKMGTSIGRAGPELVAMGQVRFDSVAASQCLKDLAGSCNAVFEPKFGRLIPCQDVFVGAVPLGGPCDGDFPCASNDCESQMCVVRPNPCAAVTCGAGQFCDATGACQPLGGVGADCHTRQCAADLTCLVSSYTCATPIADGQACTYPYDCAGSCTQLTPGLTGQTGTCRPGLCQGP